MQQISVHIGIKTRVLIRGRALGQHQMPNQLPPVAHCTLMTDPDCDCDAHNSLNLLTHVHNTKWTQMHTAITRQQPWHGASHQMPPPQIWIGQMSVRAKSQHEYDIQYATVIKKGVHGMHSNLQYLFALTMSSHVEPCAILGAKIPQNPNQLP